MTENDFYNQNAEKFIKNTLDIDMSALYSEFEKTLDPSARILDIGCGPGRDLKYFNEKYKLAEGIEPSLELCEFARVNAKASVFHGSLFEFETKAKFDGIWACASLLHIPAKQMNDAFIKLQDMLEKNGTIYCSFKYGDFEGVRDDRYFTDLTEDALGKFVQKSGLVIEKCWVSSDLRVGRESERWLNVLLVGGE